VRCIIRDSMRIDENGAFYETLKWIVHKGWNPTPMRARCPRPKP
jgi:hypothetical protein